MGYGSDYAQNVSNILLRQGDAQANARLRSGEVWSGALGQIGKTIAAIPAQMQEAKATQQEAELRQKKLDEIAAAQAKGKTLSTAYSASMNPDGTLDRQKLTTALRATPYADALPDIFKGLDEAESANLAVTKAKTDAKLASEAAETNYAKTIGSQMMAADFNPEIVNGLLTVAKTHGHDIAPFESLWTKSPEQFKAFVTKLVQPPAAPTPK